jgi:CRP/FNR family transcriptional regulator
MAMDELFRTCRQIPFENGDVIVQAIVDPKGIYLIESGLVKVYMVTDRGDEKIQHIHGPGDIFPVMWAVHHQHREVYYQAVGPVLVRSIDEDQFAHAMKDPGFLNDVLHFVMMMYRLSQQRIDILEQTRAHQRVAKGIIFLAEQFGKPTGSFMAIPEALHHHDIAAFVNVSRETASRVIAEYETTGAATYRKGVLLINPKKL